MTVVLIRLSLSAAIMFVVSKVIGKLQAVKKSDLGLLILLSFFEPFLYFLGESFGLKYVSPTVAAVIVATIPLFSPFAAWYFYKEKLSWTNFTGLLVSFFGCSLVVFDLSSGLAASPLGIALEFVAVLSTIGYAVVLKRMATSYNGFTIIAYQNLFGAFMFLPFWGVFEAKEALATPFSAEAFSAIIKLAVFASILAFIFFTYSIRKIGINKSNMFINVIPVFVAIFSFFVLDETINSQKITGITVVILGLFMAQFKRKKRWEWKLSSITSAKS